MEIVKPTAQNPFVTNLGATGTTGNRQGSKKNPTQSTPVMPPIKQVLLDAANPRSPSEIRGHHEQPSQQSTLLRGVTRTVDFITDTIVSLYNGPVTTIVGRSKPASTSNISVPTPPAPQPPAPPAPPTPAPTPTPTQSLLPAHAQIFKKLGEIDWEPTGASGMPRMKFRPEHKDLCERLEILSPDGTRVLSTGKMTGTTSKGRPIFTFDTPASSFPPGSIVMMTFKNNGGVRYTEINNPANAFNW